MDIKKTTNYSIKVTTLVILTAIVIFVIYGYRIGLFSSEETFQKFVSSFGFWAVLVFISIQIISIIIPFLPTTVGCVAGAIIFTPCWGFLYNYIGICIGSIIVFLLSRTYGSSFVKKIIGEKFYNKYIGWTGEGKKFNSMFAIAILFPVAPDDFLCYIAGLTKMKLKEFVLIILLGKPVSLALYSFGITAFLHYIISHVR